MTEYVTKPVQVTILQWSDVSAPPPGVHDVFTNPGSSPAGYLSTHEGDKIVHLGQCIVYYYGGDKHIISPDEIPEKYVPLTPRDE